MAMPKCPKERRIRSWPQQLAPPVVLRSLGFWCSATTAATSSMGRTLATAFFSFLSTNAQGDAATDQRHTALTRGTHRPHSTQQASAIRPDASSQLRRGDRRFAAFGSGTCTRRLVHLRNEVGAPKPRDPLPAPSPVGVSKWKGRDWREAPGLFSQNGNG